MYIILQSSIPSKEFFSELRIYFTTHMLLRSPGNIACNPDGNGGVYPVLGSAGGMWVLGASVLHTEIFHTNMIIYVYIV